MPRQQTQGRRPAIDVQRVLKGVRYPAHKLDLIEIAEINQASDDILDMLDELPDDDHFGGPADVQHALFGADSGEQPRKRAGHHIIDLLHQRGATGEDAIFEYCESKGCDDDEINEALDDLTEQGVCKSNKGVWSVTERDRTSVRRRGRGQQTDRQPTSRGEAEDPDPSRVSSHRRVEDDDLGEAVDNYNRRRRELRGREESEWDRRLKGHATDAIADARHMRHGYDGRGRVRDEDTDRRLADNASPALDDARHMRHGYDGRGRVRKYGPDNFDDSFEADYERYLERRRREEEGPEIDPETGSHSRRRRFQPERSGRRSQSDR